MRRIANPTSTFPAKAGIQVHPERQQGFTWAPTFVGETDEGQPTQCSRMVL
jgi:hypothetical protein